MTFEEILNQYKNTNEDVLRETPACLLSKKQGEFTVADYYDLPDDIRVELIDGVFYDMAAPTVVHQMISLKIGAMLEEYVEARNGNCSVFVAPLDVQLDRDDKTMVQPDVLVVCDESKVRMDVVSGAPDLVVEVLSASTRKKDTGLKLSKYKNAGVREYWVVDPDKMTILVYDLTKEDAVSLYGFDGQVPVGIFDGNCVIDFTRIYKRIQPFYGETFDK